MIKNLVFDFGDVFINLNKKATVQIMESYGLNGLTVEMEKVNADYETGRMHTPAFVDYYSALFPKATKTQLIEAWNAIILDFPEYRLAFIERLAVLKKYRLILLSNTNELHIDKVKQQMSVERYMRFKKCFSKFYLSHEIQLRKPNADIYEFVMKENKILPEETLFIDDTPENTEAAEKLGLHVWNLHPGKEDVINLFKQTVFENLEY